MIMIKESADRTEREPDSYIAGRICGVLLAAGAGRRAGGPKALRVDPDGTSWLLRSIAALREGGCDAVIVVLGCEAARARDLLASSTFAGDRLITVVNAPNWQQAWPARCTAVCLPHGHSHAERCWCTWSTCLT